LIVRALSAPTEARGGLPSSWRGWRSWARGFGLATAAGPRVNEQTALWHAAVYACVTFLARNIAGLPLCVLERGADGESHEKARSHPLFPVLAKRANALQTSFQARQFLMASLLLRGNGLAWKRLDGRGRVMAYLPVRWDQVRLEIERGEPVYVWQPERGEVRRWRRNEVLHQTGLSLDGIEGVSPIAAAREAIGWGLAMQEHGSRFFSNGTNVGGVLSHPGTLSEPAQERLVATLEERHQATENAWKTLVLEEGMSYEAMGVSPRDAQFLDSRQFSAVEICAFYGVKPHLAGFILQGSASFASLEQQALELVLFTLDPWLVNLEQSYERDLLTDAERDDFTIKHNVDALLRGDARTRAEVNRIGVMTGYVSRNEVRRREDLAPSEGLDEFLVPLNMAEEGGDGPTPIGSGRDPAFQPQPPAPPARARPRPREQRVAEPASERRARVAERFRPLLEAAGRRILRAELRKLRALADENVPPEPDPGEVRLVDWLVTRPGGRRRRKKRPEVRDLAGFVAAAEPLYAPGDPAGELAAGELHELAERELRGPLEALGLSIFDLAAEEVDGETDRQGLDEFIGALAAAAVAGWAIHSIRALEALVSTDSELADAERVDAVFEQWAKARAEKTARRESVKVARAASREAFKRSGATLLRWRTRGDTCPFCSQFDGRVVAIEGGSFAEPGQLEADDRAPLSIARPIGHPPLHRGCDCEIEAAG
jgi:HK97 family phage portal protein